MRRPDGFTLVELLVVISVISILMGILLPVFARVREGARRTKCSHNLAEIGGALTLYAEDHRGWYPPIQTDSQIASGGIGGSVTPSNQVEDSGEEMGLGRMWRPYISEKDLEKFEELLDVVTCPSTDGWNKKLEGVGLGDGDFYCSYLYRGAAAPIEGMKMYTLDDRDAMVKRSGTLALVTDANHDNDWDYFNHDRVYNLTLYADGSVDGKDLMGEPNAEALIGFVDDR